MPRSPSSPRPHASTSDVNPLPGASLLFQTAEEGLSARAAEWGDEGGPPPPPQGRAIGASLRRSARNPVPKFTHGGPQPRIAGTKSSSASSSSSVRRPKTRQDAAIPGPSSKPVKPPAGGEIMKSVEAEPVIPAQMGGRYAQTAGHPNGQPHAPGLLRAGTAPTTRRHPAAGEPDARPLALSRMFNEIVASASAETTRCMQCMYDIKIESRRRIARVYPPLYASYAHGARPQIPTLAPSRPGMSVIAFRPILQPETAMYGVAMIDILDFKDVMQDARAVVLRGRKDINLTIEIAGFPPLAKQLASNCEHRPVTRFNLAYSIAEAFLGHFMGNKFNEKLAANSPGVHARAITQLRLVSIYTTDKVNYRAHLAYVL